MTESWRRHWLVVVGLLLAVCVVQWRWVWSEPRYFADDAAGYFDVSFETRDVFLNYGPLNAAIFAYGHRYGKPVLMPQLMTPFLLAANGDARMAFNFYAPLVAVFLILGIYATLAFFIPRKRDAFFAAIFIYLAPWSLGGQSSFMLEGPWLASAFWFFAFFLRSKAMTEPRPAWAAAGCLLFSLLIRPAESLVCLWIPFTVVLLVAEPAHLRRNVSIVLAEGFTAAAVLFWPVYIGKSSVPLVALFCVFAGYGLFTFWKIRRLQSLTLNIWSLILGGCIFWYLPAAKLLIEWIFVCGLGGYVEDVYKSGLGEYNFLERYFWKMGWIFLIPLPVAGALLPPWKTWWKNNRRLWAAVSWLALALPAIGYMTYSRDFRYYTLGWAAIAIVSLASLHAALKSRRIGNYFPLLMALLAVCQIHFVDKNTVLTGEFLRRPHGADVDFLNFFDKLVTLIPDPRVSIAFNKAGDPTIWEEVNPYKLKLRANESGRHWGVAWPESYSSQDPVTEYAAKGEILVVGPPEAYGDPPPNALTAQISKELFACASEGCVKYGLRLLGEHTFAASNKRAEQKFLIFQNDAAKSQRHRINPNSPDNFFRKLSGG